MESAAAAAAATGYAAGSTPTRGRRPRLRDLEAKWNNRFPFDVAEGTASVPGVSPPGIREYDALSDQHCTYIRSENFKSSPYVHHAES